MIGAVITFVLVAIQFKMEAKIVLSSANPTFLNGNNVHV